MEIKGPKALVSINNEDQMIWQLYELWWAVGHSGDLAKILHGRNLYEQSLLDRTVDYRGIHCKILT